MANAPDVDKLEQDLARQKPPAKAKKKPGPKPGFKKASPPPAAPPLKPGTLAKLIPGEPVKYLHGLSNLPPPEELPVAYLVRCIQAGIKLRDTLSGALGVAPAAPAGSPN